MTDPYTTPYHRTSRFHMTVMFCFVLACWVLVVPGGASAQEKDESPRSVIYQYVDDFGQVHFVDDIHLIPERYRTAQRLTEIPVQDSSPPAEPEPSSPPAPSSASTTTSTTYFIPLESTDAKHPQDPAASPAEAVDDAAVGGRRTGDESLSTSEKLEHLRKRQAELEELLAAIEIGVVQIDEWDEYSDSELEQALIKTLEELVRVDQQIERLEKDRARERRR